MITFYTARAHKAGAPQTIPNGTDTKVTFDTKDWDPNTCFDLGNNRFVVPEAGKYLCVAEAHYETPVGDKPYAIGIRKNGNWWDYRRINPPTADSHTLGISAIVDCAANDYLEVFVWQGSGGNDDISTGSMWTFFEIHRLS